MTARPTRPLEELIEELGRFHWAIERHARDEFRETMRQLRALLAVPPEGELWNPQHDWQLSDGKSRYLCSVCGQWTANMPLYRDEICPKRERREGERRREPQ